MSDQLSILPPNSTALELALEQGVTADTPDLAPIGKLMNAETCPPELLGWLAWAFSVETWGADWSEGAKRQAIAGSIEVHRRKGTIGSVRRALADTGYGDAEIIERFGHETYDGAILHDGSVTHSEPDHWAEYRLRLARPITSEQAAQVREILANIAPARARLKALDFTEVANTYNAQITYDGQFTHGVA
mgnify:CR=1 FL=1